MKPRVADYFPWIRYIYITNIYLFIIIIYIYRERDRQTDRKVEREI